MTAQSSLPGFTAEHALAPRGRHRSGICTLYPEADELYPQGDCGVLKAIACAGAVLACAGACASGVGLPACAACFTGIGASGCIDCL